MLEQIASIATGEDLEVWKEAASQFGIDPAALDILDRVGIRYPFYFCKPSFLIDNPLLIAYYRNIAMVSAKVMRGIGLDTTPHEIGVSPLPPDKAERLSAFFNSTVNALLLANSSLVTATRHIETVLTNIGASIDGSWRNEVGRLAYAEVIGGLLRYLYRKDLLSSVSYDLKGPIIEDDNDDGGTVTSKDNQLTSSEDFLEYLQDAESNRIVYKEIELRNGYQLLLNRQVVWRDKDEKAYKIGPDLSSVSGEGTFVWGGELKGGADPAGSDEHWKTAKSAFDRILDAATETGRPKPKLSFIATILVDRVAREAALWIQQGKLTSVYNLTQIAEIEDRQELFLSDLARFLGCE
ncbi:MAG: XcyI family restriction endonuclease [Chloroflexi bacterium]|nr:XcyI family restriction endonuclease [Chloroflexota bacterium]